MWQPYHRQNFYFNCRKSYLAPSEGNSLMDKSGYFLATAKTDRLHPENVFINGMEIGHTSIQGYRPSMEDSHLIKATSLAYHTLVAIFDGHAGAESAAYLSENMLALLEQTAQWQQYAQLSEAERVKHAKLICEAFVAAYIKADDDLRAKEYVCGSTAVCSLITPSHIFAASVGDSRCVLGLKDGTTVAMSEDHVPTLADEHDRIEAAGGFVFLDRVNGELAMSRALGDFQYKQVTNKTLAEQLVICVPDVAVHERSGHEAVMILACDGVWDVLENRDSIGLLMSLIESAAEDEQDGAISSEELADQVVEAALKLRSTDNISALVVKFGNT